jgi:ribA/ribD-fused uncharacterized protein
MLFHISNELEDALRFSRFDDAHPLSTVSPHGFVLEGVAWLTAEHCYQAQKFSHSPDYSAQIAAAAAPLLAYRLGNRWWRPKRPDFKRVRRTLMTRALFCKAQQNPGIAQFLLGTGEQKLVETSLYDHYWGIGRDLRGWNTLGEVWMDVRRHLREK